MALNNITMTAIKCQGDEGNFTLARHRISRPTRMV